MSESTRPDPATPSPAAATSSATEGSACRVCSNTGMMRWQQPVPTANGQMRLREMRHPCTCAAAREAGVWRHPAAEDDRVVDTDDPGDGTGGRWIEGQAAAAQRTQPGLEVLLAAADPTRPAPER